MNRTWLTLLVVPLLMPGLHAGHAACPDTTIWDDAMTIKGTKDVACTTLHIRAPITVQGTLNLETLHVVFEDAGRIHVDKGRLHLDDVRMSGATQITANAGDIKAQDTVADGPRWTTTGGKMTLANSTFSTSTGTLVQATQTQVDLTEATLALQSKNVGTALALNESKAILHHSTIGPALYAVTAKSASVVTMEEAWLVAGQASVRALDTTKISLDDSQLTGTYPLWLEGKAEAKLRDTDIDAEDVQRIGDGSRLVTQYTVFVQVQAASEAPGVPIDSVEVEALGVLDSNTKRMTDAEGIAGPWTAQGPSIFAGLSGVVDGSRPLFVARHDSSAAAAPVITIDTSHPRDNPVLIDIRNDPDDEAPTWPTGATVNDDWQAPPADASILNLTWTPASDDPSGDAPHRKILGYRVDHTSPDDVTSRFTRLHSMSFTGLESGRHFFGVRAIDLTGNIAALPELHEVVVDRTGPTIWAVTTNDVEAGPKPLHFAQQPTLDFKAKDDDAEIESLEWIQGTTATPWIDPVHVEEPGVHVFTIRATNALGSQTQRQFKVILDEDAPIPSLAFSPALPDGEAGWYRTQPNASATADDAGIAGLASMEMRVNQGAWVPANASINMPAGRNVIVLRATDGAGNEASVQRIIQLDDEAPTVTIKPPNSETSWFNRAVDVELATSDAGSGVRATELRRGAGAWLAVDNIVTLSASGEHVLTARAWDHAGNLGQPDTETILIDLEAPEPPRVIWTQEPGTVSADWSLYPGRDVVSGLASYRLEAQRDGGVTTLATIESTSSAMQHAGLVAGQHRLRIVAVDVAGNEAATPWTLMTTTESLDRVVASKQVAGTTQLSYKPPAGFTPAEVRFNVDGLFIASDTSAPYAIQWDTRNFRDGAYEVKTVAINAAGATHVETQLLEIQNSYTTVADGALWPLLASASVNAAAMLVATIALSGWWRWRRP